MPGRKKEVVESRFWRMVAVNEVNDCWHWKGSTYDGYGSFRLNKSKTIRAHRLAYMLSSGLDKIPDNLCCCHRCDVRNCCNPKHLFLGTKKDNTRDMIDKGRDAYSGGYRHSEETKKRIGEASKGHTLSKESRRKIAKKNQGERSHLAKLTEKEVIEIRKLYDKKEYTQQTIANRFNVSERTVRDIKNRKSWKFLD